MDQYNGICFRTVLSTNGFVRVQPILLRDFQNLIGKVASGPEINKSQIRILTVYQHTTHSFNGAMIEATSTWGVNISAISFNTLFVRSTLVEFEAQVGVVILWPELS